METGVTLACSITRLRKEIDDRIANSRSALLDQQFISATRKNEYAAWWPTAAGTRYSGAENFLIATVR